jgi:hypothetical protein
MPSDSADSRPARPSPLLVVVDRALAEIEEDALHRALVASVVVLPAPAAVIDRSMDALGWLRKQLAIRCASVRRRLRKAAK